MFGVAPFLGAQSNEEFSDANMDFIDLVTDDFSDMEGTKLQEVDVGNKYDDQFVHDVPSLNKGIAIGSVSYQTHPQPSSNSAHTARQIQVAPMS